MLKNNYFYDLPIDIQERIHKIVIDEQRDLINELKKEQYRIELMERCVGCEYDWTIEALLIGLDDRSWEEITDLFKEFYINYLCYKDNEEEHITMCGENYDCCKFNGDCKFWKSVRNNLRETCNDYKNDDEEFELEVC